MGSSKDVVVCALCGHRAVDLTWHLKRVHGMSASSYKEKHGVFVSPSVAEKRRRTNLERHGSAHFTNRPAAALTNKTFEGGHSLRDPEVRRKAADTMEARYGDRHYTNRSKARKTCLERYGVEHACAAPEVVRKRVSTLKERYGKTFNVSRPHNKTDVPEGFRADYANGVTVEDLCAKYGVSEPTLRRWVRETGLRRRAANARSRLVEEPGKVVSDYVAACLEHGGLLSFGEYGKRFGGRLTTKLKRLFNKRGRYHDLHGLLCDVASGHRPVCDLLEKLT